MIYLYLNDNTIKLLALAKSLFGQYSASFFQKLHATRLLDDGRVVTVDLLASAVKEALTLAAPAKIKEKNVCLILPQKAFEFDRFDVSSDIAPAAIASFIEDKFRAKSEFALEEVLYDYLLVKQENESKVLFFAQRREVFAQYHEVLKLLGLTIDYIVPESLCYFTLFAKTLRRDKKENILYVYYQDQQSHGYLYDSLGLIRQQVYRFDDPIETALHQTAADLDQKGLKLNRVVLSGVKSENIRQDLFTKKVGVWTNPLGKIITNFYQDYLKLLLVTGQPPSFLDFDVCFGAFVAYCEHNVFSVKEMLKRQPKKSGRLPGARPALSLPAIQGRDLIVFLISFVISFAAIFFYSRLKSVWRLPAFVKFAAPRPTPTATPSPQPSPTPTPVVDRQTVKIKVLNGGGVRGKAAEVRDILKEQGYSEVLTDNADSFDYETTQIQAKDGQEAAANVLKTDLADYAAIGEITPLEEDSAADLVLIIGQDFE